MPRAGLRRCGCLWSEERSGEAGAIDPVARLQRRTPGAKAQGKGVAEVWSEGLAPHPPCRYLLPVGGEKETSRYVGVPLWRRAGHVPSPRLRGEGYGEGPLAGANQAAEAAFFAAMRARIDSTSAFGVALNRVCVYSCFGLENTSSRVPYSTASPKYITITSSAM